MSSKLRDALLKADVLISIATFEEGVKMDEVDKIRSEIKAALAEPLRNCDVGTAEEQVERYMNFCHNFSKCIGCPCVGRMKYNHCEFAWLQMPYESEVK